MLKVKLQPDCSLSWFFSGKDLEIDHEGVLDVSGRGWSHGVGPGAGLTDSNGGSGGSHGGEGGRGGGASFSADAYGDTMYPEHYGSGGSDQNSNQKVDLI